MKIVQNCKNLVLLGAVALLAGCGATHDEMLSDVSKALESNLVKGFAELKFEEQSYARGMHPKVAFAGKTSTILVQETPKLESHAFGLDAVNLTGLAITKSGRYFLFTYSSDLLANMSVPLYQQPCIEADCRYFRYNRSISRQDAMEWFYRSDKFTPERFKALFDEEAPPKKVEA